jgi:RND family efflux transporter MFP subunit
MRIQSGHSRRSLYVFAAIALVVAVVVSGLMNRRSQASQLQAQVADRAIATVALVSPSTLAPGNLQLPGRIEAWSRAPIYARVSGYLKRWNSDIGTPVKAGQVLAEIETPDLDQQLLQAQAELATARSTAAQAASTARRWESLLKSDSVSRQEVEERTSDLTAKRSMVNALQANVDRVQALQRYKQIVAPFDGIVTARNTDVGSLINVGMTRGSELFVVSDTQKLRVYVSVPQRQLALVRTGGKAYVSIPERPGKTYAAVIQSLAQAVDADSGAMRVQLSVDNASGELLPGAFASVRFDTSAGEQHLGLPPSALIVGKNGVQIATVDASGRVQLKAVTITRDHGTVIEFANGIAPEDKVIANPPDGLASGDQVKIAAATSAGRVQ